jgi:hypothetical protein
MKPVRIDQFVKVGSRKSMLDSYAEIMDPLEGFQSRDIQNQQATGLQYLETLLHQVRTFLFIEGAERVIGDNDISRCRGITARHFPQVALLHMKPAFMAYVDCMLRQIESFQMGVVLSLQIKHEPSGTTPGIDNGNVATHGMSANGVQDEMMQGSIPPMFLLYPGHFFIFISSFQHGPYPQSGRQP